MYYNLVYLNFPCQAEWADLVLCLQPTLLSHLNPLSQVQAAQIGMNAIGRTTTTIHVRRQAVQAESEGILWLIFWMGCLVSMLMRSLP